MGDTEEAIRGVAKKPYGLQKLVADSKRLGFPHEDEASFNWTQAEIPVIPTFLGELLKVNQEVLKRFRSTQFVEKGEEDMYISSDGNLYIPIRYYFVLLPTIFIMVCLSFPLLGFYASWKIMRCVLQRQVDAKKKFFDVMLSSMCCCCLLFTTTAPLNVWCLEIFHGGTKKLVHKNIISGVEAWISLLFPLIVAWYITALQFVEFSVTKETLSQALNEFEDDGLYDEEKKPVSDILDIPSDKPATMADMRKYVNDMNKVFAYYDGTEYTNLFLPRFIIETSNTFSAIHVATQGASYAEKWALHLMSLTRCLAEVQLAIHYKLGSAALGILQASIPAMWMRYHHRDQYLGGSFSTMIGTHKFHTGVALTNAISTFILTLGIMCITFSRLELFKRSHCKISTLLMISCTPISRRIVKQFCRPFLQDVRMFPLSEIEEESSSPRQVFQTLSEVSSEMQNQPSILDAYRTKDEMDSGVGWGEDTYVEELDKLSKKILKQRLALLAGGCGPVRAEKRSVLWSLDVDLWSKLRRWIRVEVGIEGARLANMVMLLLGGVLMGFIAVVCNLCIYNQVTCVTVWVMPILVVGALMAIICLNSMMLVNTTMGDVTIKVLMNWIDRIKRTSKENRTDDKRHVVQDVQEQQTDTIPLARLQVDNYFRSLIDPLEYVVNNIQMIERPITFLSIPITIQFRNRIMAILATTALTSICKLISSEYGAQISEFVENSVPA
jgi:hypothetical protein